MLSDKISRKTKDLLPFHDTNDELYINKKNYKWVKKSKI